MIKNNIQQGMHPLAITIYMTVGSYSIAYYIMSYNINIDFNFAYRKEWYEGSSSDDHTCEE